MSKKHNNYNKMFGADRDEAKEEVEEVIEGAVIPEIMEEVKDIIESEPEETEEEAVEETVEEPEPMPTANQVFVAAKNLNVRKKPSKDGEVAFVAHEGDSFEAIESAGDWTKVLAKGYDVPLYVMSKFLN